jgi:hypothetical protein
MATQSSKGFGALIADGHLTGTEVSPIPLMVRGCILQALIEGIC